MTALPNRDRRAERRQATRREIVDAAWDIARTSGLAAVTLREVALRVGMRAPSLYSHFESKNAIYDAMFGEAWSEYLSTVEGSSLTLPAAPRRALLTIATHFFDFAVADPARYQLMNQRVLGEFEPSPENYAPAVRVLELLVESLRGIGATRTEDLDVWRALIGGLVDNQLANDVGGERFRRLLPRSIDMFADDLGLPGPRLRRNR